MTHRFPREKFPITLEFLHPETRNIVHTMTIETPEKIAMFYIPPVAKMVGHEVVARIIFADGEAFES